MRGKFLTFEGQQYQRLERTVQGVRVIPELCYRLRAEEGRMVLEAWRAAEARQRPGAVSGLYCEELWRYDCVELFMRGEGSDGYMEFNLSPGGAWWACWFRAPRKVASEEPRRMFCGRGVQARGECTQNSWRAQLSVPWDLLTEHGICRESCRAAVCAILLDENGERRFMTSYHNEPSDPPDFHRPHLWLPLQLSSDSL